MTHDERPEPLAPPLLAREKVVELVSYAEHVVEMLQWEMRDLRRLNHDISEFPAIIEGWEFMALALRETYDLDETDFPR